MSLVRSLGYESTQAAPGTADADRLPNTAAAAAAAAAAERARLGAAGLGLEAA